MPSLKSFLTIGNPRVKVHTTDDADASPTPKAPLAAEELPIKEIILDKTGRLLIDVVDNTPHGKQTYRHRVSVDVMEQASPVWKKKIFGPEGKERHQPTEEEDRIVLLRDGDDEPLPILVQLALIHDQPRWITKFVAAADKYAVLPRLRPFVADWLLHARPPSRIGGRDGIDPEMLDQLNVAWQLGEVGRVEDYIQKLAYDSNVSAEWWRKCLSRRATALSIGSPRFRHCSVWWPSAGRRASRRVWTFSSGCSVISAATRGACRQPMWDTTIIPGYTPEVFAAFEKLLGPAVDDHATNCGMCNIVLDMEISTRLEEEGPIPALARDFHSSISRLLYTIRCVHGMQDGAVPARQVPGHACLQNLRKKFEDFAAELRSRWSGRETILELEQVEWLKTRRDVLAMGGSS